MESPNFRENPNSFDDTSIWIHELTKHDASLSLMNFPQLSVRGCPGWRDFREVGEALIHNNTQSFNSARSPGPSRRDCTVSVGDMREKRAAPQLPIEGLLALWKHITLLQTNTRRIATDQVQIRSMGFQFDGFPLPLLLYSLLASAFSQSVTVLPSSSS